MNPFEKKTPSVFSVCSPFQILCAIAAIRQLEIDDYLMVVRLPDGGERNDQMTNLLRTFKIKYRSIKTINMNRILLKMRLPHFGRYKRLFIGDFRDLLNCYIGCGLVSNHSDVVYLDDGNVTINQLSCREFGNIIENNLVQLKKIAKYRGLVFYKNLLTIYDDIPNNNYNIESLSLKRILSERKSSITNKDVYVVGTNVDSFCIPQGLEEKSFISYLDFLLYQLKIQYPKENIYYIPHGREYKLYAETLCEKHGVIYRRSSIMIEMELISSPNIPKAIYGFTSTALFTLKKLFPSTMIVNILFKNKEDNPYYIDYCEISDYYQKNGINTIVKSLQEPYAEGPL